MFHWGTKRNRKENLEEGHQNSKDTQGREGEEQRPRKEK